MTPGETSEVVSARQETIASVRWKRVAAERHRTSAGRSAGRLPLMTRSGGGPSVCSDTRLPARSTETSHSCGLTRISNVRTVATGRSSVTPSPLAVVNASSTRPERPPPQNVGSAVIRYRPSGPGGSSVMPAGSVCETIAALPPRTGTEPPGRTLSRRNAKRPPSMPSFTSPARWSPETVAAVSAPAAKPNVRARTPAMICLIAFISCSLPASPARSTLQNRSNVSDKSDPSDVSDGSDLSHVYNPIPISLRTASAKPRAGA